MHFFEGRGLMQASSVKQANVWPVSRLLGLGMTQAKGNSHHGTKCIYGLASFSNAGIPP